MGFLSSLFGSSKSKPATSTNVISQKLPEEIAPFAKEVLQDAQELYRTNVERGYDPYTGKTIAPFTPQEEQAMTGISGLVGTSRPLQEEALETYRRGGDEFTAEVAERFMSPYQQAVTDIEKREAQKKFEGTVMPQFEAKAVGAGGMSGLGTRAGVEAAELQRGQSQLLADIQARGQQRAFEDARKGFEAQQARERQMAEDISRVGPAMLATGLQEQGALQSVGEQKRDLAQSAMDEAYFRFLEEQQFPQQQLANYSGFVYGNPAAGLVQQTGTGTKTPYQPSFGQTILGLGSGLASSFLGSPTGANRFANFAFGPSKGKTGGGIAGLVERQTGKQVGSGETGFEKARREMIEKNAARRAAEKERFALMDQAISKSRDKAIAKEAARQALRKAELRKRGAFFTDDLGSPQLKAKEQELARAREVLQSLSTRKEPPKSVDTETPAVPKPTVKPQPPKKEEPKPKPIKKLTAKDYKNEGLRTEEDILKRAEDIAQEKEKLIGDRTRYGVAEGLSDVLGYIAQRALTGESKMDFFTKRQESQKEAEKLLTKTKLQNIDAKSIAEDLGYKAESDLKKAVISRIQKVQTAKLTRTKMLAEIKKIIEETKNLEGGNTGYSFSSIDVKDREDVAKGLLLNYYKKLPANVSKEDRLKFKLKVEQLEDDGILDSLAGELMARQGDKKNLDKTIQSLLKQSLQGR